MKKARLAPFCKNGKMVFGLIAVLLTFGLIAAFAACKNGPSYEGNFVPPAWGEGTLLSVGEGVFTMQAEKGSEGGHITNNATEDGIIVLSVRDEAMERQLATEFEVGDLLYVEYSMNPDVISDDGQITCSSIRHAD